MPRRLQEEIKQTKPFETLQDEVALQILVTSEVLKRWVVEALKPSGLTPSQFNVLRILRGARPDALPGNQIAERMVNYDPDVTRLLDRLDAAGLIEKARDERDRRVVNVRITKAGLRAVESASQAVSARLESTLAQLGKRKLTAMAELLELARASGG